MNTMLKVRNKYYSIEETDNKVILEKLNEMYPSNTYKDTFFGFCDVVGCTIYINKSAKYKKDTLLHESIHAVIWETTVSTLDTYTEEQMVRFIESNFKEVLKIAEQVEQICIERGWE